MLIFHNRIQNEKPPGIGMSKSPAGFLFGHSNIKTACLCLPDVNQQVAERL